MTEGELEKRINKMLFLSHAGKDLDDDYEQKRVHQIIEEIRNEFPKLSKKAEEQYTEWEKIGCDYEEAWDIEQKLNARRENWFRKYFGEK